MTFNLICRLNWVELQSRSSWKHYVNFCKIVLDVILVHLIRHKETDITNATVQDRQISQVDRTTN